MLKHSFVALTLTCVVAMPALAEPRLHFSDLASGPKAGNSDTSLGQTAGEDGTIVTVWGAGLGEAQGNSKITINGAPPARVYYWGKAVPPYSPANLHARHHMQAIIFQISHDAKDGAGGITVVVEGKTSNEIPFVVRPGRIHFVMTDGNDAGGDGSWAKPWRSIPRAIRKMAAGDITYVGDGVTQTTEDSDHAAVNLSLNGEKSRPAALVAYPGATVRIGGDRLNRGFHYWLSGYGYTHDWTIAKFHVTAGEVAIPVNSGFRVVGNYITAPTGNAPSGAVHGGGNGLLVLGNELTKVGKPRGNKLYHPIYIQSDRASSGPRRPAESDREIAWNYLHDNDANSGINIYSENVATAYMSGHRVHDNFIINQRGIGILLGSYMTGENWVYNNVVAFAGLGPEPEDGDHAMNHIGVRIALGVKGGPPTTLHFYSNTIYGCGWGKAAWGPAGNGALSFDNLSLYTLDFRNNIIVSTGEPYLAERKETPKPAKGHNLWFGAGKPPAWDLDALNVDPRFADPAVGDFRLKADSPAIDKGPTGEWVDVTNNVGGEKWGAYGVTCMKAVPGSEAVIAGISECGLWLTNDGGATWKKLGGNEIKNRPGRIVFDPKDSSIFWVSGCYGDAPFKTEDGGKTFMRLGKLAHADGVAVDFGDPERKTLLLGLHEQSQSLQLSTDGGQSWKKIGDKLPADSNHSTDPVIIDSKTFLVNTAGWKPKATLGIYRTENAGETWTSVSTFGPAGEPLIASDGAIYWQRLWGGGLLKSTDRGKTWSAISNAIKSNPIELPGKRLAGLAGNQIMASSDDGVTWTKLGPPAPFRPNGLTYSEKGKCFYAWQLADNLKKPAQSIVRLNIE